MAHGETLTNDGLRKLSLMVLDNTEQKTVATRGATLQRRLESESSGTQTTSTETVEEWLREWQENVADDDEAAFTARVDMYDLTTEECRSKLRTWKWPEDEPIPDWVSELDNILEHVITLDREYLDVHADEDHIPFKPILLAFVDYASAQVDWDGMPDSLTQTAVEDCERWLLERLATIFTHPLFIKFKTFIAEDDRELAFADDPDIPPQTTEYYDEFVDHFLADGLVSFVQEYAVASKLLVTACQQWRMFVEEFGQRLDTDLKALEETFRDGDQLGAVESLGWHGDAHQGGKLVLEVIFEAGTKVIYKPRSVDGEAGFSTVVDRVNEWANLPDLRAADCVQRDGYGWMEWVQTEECTSRRKVGLYYRRAGMLMALLYALNFSDGILENVVAAGAQPVVIDLETVMHPPIKRSKTTRPDTGETVVEGSVLGTGLLPNFVPDADIRGQNGLSRDRAKARRTEPLFEEVNTDRMDMKFEDVHTIEGSNLPRLDGRSIDPEAFHKHIRTGFEEMYRVLLDRQERLLANDGLLTAFEDADLRVLYRPTVDYAKVRTALESSSYLRQGAAASVRIERLARPFVTDITDRDVWSAYEAERAALWRFDIPRFSVTANESTISCGDSDIDQVIEKSPQSRVRDRIERLDENDLSEQLDYIDLAYAPEKFYEGGRDIESISGTSNEDNVEAVTPPIDDADEKADIYRAAREIFDRLRDNSSQTSDGYPLWNLREYRFFGVYLPRMPDNLYTGRVGIGLFAAAMHATFGDDKYRTFAQSVLEPCLNELEESDPFEMMKLGGTLGISSVVYGLATVGDLLDSDRYLAAAQQTANQLTGEKLTSNRYLGPHRGSAGAILALDSLYDSTGDTEVLNTARTFADDLLTYRNEDADDAVHAWRVTLDDIPSDDLADLRLSMGTNIDDIADIGVPHGADAIPYALARMATTMGENRYYDMALDAAELDRNPPIRDVCPDLRIQHDEECTTGWCEGVAGHGLARLGLFEVTDNERFRTEAKEALGTMSSEVLVDQDHLYAGNLGRVEFLLRAGRTFDEPSYHQQARNLAWATVKRSKSRGQFRVPWQTDHWYNPSFFVGESGIGYSLLRLYNPDLPNVLLWD